MSLVSWECRQMMRQPGVWRRIDWSPQGQSVNVFGMIEFLQQAGLTGAVRMLDIPKFCGTFPSLSDLLAPLQSSLRCLSIRNAKLGPVSTFEPEDEETSMLTLPEQGVNWPNIKFLNLFNTDLTKCDLLNQLTVPNAETMVMSGVIARSEDLLNFILRSRKTLKHLDISRTGLDEAQVTLITCQSLRLESLVATELKWKPAEEVLQQQFRSIKVRTQLLPLAQVLIEPRMADVACLYDIDGKGVSLLADAIYVGITCKVIEYLITALEIDVNRCGTLPSPWRLPYPTKYIEGFDLLRAALPFHQAVITNKFDIATLLLSFGANARQKTPYEIC